MHHVIMENRPLIGLLFLTQAIAEGGGLCSALRHYECYQDEAKLPEFLVWCMSVWVPRSHLKAYRCPLVLGNYVSISIIINVPQPTPYSLMASR
jgi:hypothetical protein